MSRLFISIILGTLMGVPVPAIAKKRNCEENLKHVGEFWKQTTSYRKEKHAVMSFVLDLKETDTDLDEQYDAESKERFFEIGQLLADKYFSANKHRSKPKPFKNMQDLENAATLWWYRQAYFRTMTLQDRLKLSLHETEDLLQELMTAANIAIKRFDPHKGRNFYKYLMYWFNKAEKTFIQSVIDQPERSKIRVVDDTSLLPCTYCVPDYSNIGVDFAITQEVVSVLRESFSWVYPGLFRGYDSATRFTYTSEFYRLVLEERILPLLDRVEKGEPLGEVPSQAALAKILKHKSTSVISAHEVMLKNAVIEHLINAYDEEIVSWRGVDTLFALGRKENETLKKAAERRGLHFGNQGVQYLKVNTFKTWAASQLRSLPAEDLVLFRSELKGHSYEFILNEVYLKNISFKKMSEILKMHPSSVAYTHKNFKRKLVVFFAERGIDVPPGLN